MPDTTARRGMKPSNRRDFPSFFFFAFCRVFGSAIAGLLPIPDIRTRHRFGGPKSPARRFRSPVPCLSIPKRELQHALPGCFRTKFRSDRLFVLTSRLRSRRPCRSSCRGGVRFVRFFRSFGRRCVAAVCGKRERGTLSRSKASRVPFFVPEPEGDQYWSSCVFR